jgi:hypothetical protein
MDFFRYIVHFINFAKEILSYLLNNCVCSIRNRSECSDENFHEISSPRFYENLVRYYKYIFCYSENFEINYHNYIFYLEMNLSDILAISFQIPFIHWNRVRGWGETLWSVICMYKYECVVERKLQLCIVRVDK